MAGEEGNENSCKSVSYREGCVCPPEIGSDFEKTRKPRASASNHAAKDHEPANWQSLRQCSAGIAAGDTCGKSEIGSRHQEIEKNRDDDSSSKPPVNLATEHFTDHVLRTDGRSGRLVRRPGVAKRAFYEKVHCGDRDIREK
jgi:hypothetical protein